VSVVRAGLSGRARRGAAGKTLGLRVTGSERMLDDDDRKWTSVRRGSPHQPKSQGIVKPMRRYLQRCKSTEVERNSKRADTVSPFSRP